MAKKKEQNSLAKLSKEQKREIISHVLDDYYGSDDFYSDLKELEPRDRLSIVERLSAYCIPKLQATSVDLLTSGKKTIEDRLAALIKPKN